MFFFCYFFLLPSSRKFHIKFRFFFVCSFHSHIKYRTPYTQWSKKNPLSCIICHLSIAVSLSLLSFVLFLFQLFICFSFSNWNTIFFPVLLFFTLYSLSLSLYIGYLWKEIHVDAFSFSSFDSFPIPPQCSPAPSQVIKRRLNIDLRRVNFWEE